MDFSSLCLNLVALLYKSCMKNTPVDTNELRKDNPEAFRVFFKRSYPQLMGLACRFVEAQTARDLVQDVFLSYWEQKSSIQIENPQSYLYKMLKNKCLDYLKHQVVVEDYKSRVRIAEARIAYLDNHTDLNDVFTRVASQDIRELIEESVDKLPPKCAQAFRLSYFHDIPHKEIAEVMSISVRTVETHIRKAVSLLRIDLRKILMLVLMFFSIK